jgi:hypothetical protein
MKVIDGDAWLPGMHDPAPDVGRLVGPGGAYRLPLPPGYGLDNYDAIFTQMPAGGHGNELPSASDHLKKADELVRSMDAADIEVSVVSTVARSVIREVAQRHPSRILCLVRLSPFDGMRAVRELESCVRDGGVRGLQVSSMNDLLPASDRRYYPLYAKCVELDIPVRIYATLTLANDRPYDLGHPKHLDQVASDFPELTIVAGEGGWPWGQEMTALLRRHPRLYVDTSSHRPRHFNKPGSGWEPLMLLGNNVLQDKVIVGLSSDTFGASRKEIIAEYEDLPLKDRVKEKWLYENARSVYLPA